MDKIRLDKALLNQISSRAKAQDMIKEGKISVNGKVITKVSFLVGDEDDIVVTHTEDEFVSRGAFKLKGCLDKYNVNIQNQVVLDIGASTGGFTDVCLRYGAKKVYALDVGHLQLAKELEQRYERLGNFRDIKAYNKANPDNLMKYQFVVIEECFSLLQYKKHYEKLGEIMSKARACGMHFMLTTQRPNGDIIPKVAYTHVGVKVGLRTSSAQESINAIEAPGLEKISDRGAGIINLNGRYIFFKGSYISDEQITNIARKYTRKSEKQFLKETAVRENKEIGISDSMMFKF